MDKTREELLRENEELRLNLIALEVDKNIFKNTDIKLVESRRILDTIFNGLSEGIFLIDKDFKVLWANKAMLDSTGCNKEGAVNEYCYKLTHHRNTPCLPPYDICPITEVIKNGKPITVTHTHYDKDGQKKIVEVSAYPVRDEKDEIAYFIHMSRDITKKARQEENLEISENVYHVLFNAMPEAIILCQLDTFRITNVNLKGSEIFKYPSCNEMVGMKLTDLLDSQKLNSKEVLISLLNKAVRSKGLAFDWLAKDREARLFWVELEAKNISIGLEGRLLVIMRPMVGKRMIE